jgi:type IV fimbrial biogenesis protein FimT
LKHTRVHGFTLIEAMVTIAILAIIISIGVPSLRGVMVSNKMAFISNEFGSALQQTRALAIARNSCATICAAADITSTSTYTSANCNPASAAVNDFHAGWIIFENPSCDTNQRSPIANGNILNTARGPQPDGYSLIPSDNALSMVMFDPKGLANLATSGNFQVSPPAGTDASYKRTICLDAAGRALVRQYTTTCS